MRGLLPVPVVVLLSGLVLSFAQVGWAGELTPAERGRQVLIHNPLNPALWTLKAYENAWKQWGVPEKPRDYLQAFNQRYGLHQAPFDNHGLPMGLVETRGLLSKGIINSCLMCHASAFAGQTIMGLGNVSLDLQTLFEELSAGDGIKLQLPFQFSYVRGTIDPVNPVIFLAGFRDADLNLQKQLRLDYFDHVCSDPPAWWLLKKKKTRDWTGTIDARSTRVDLVNLFTPFNSGEYIKKQQPVFADIHAFLLSLEAPKYPFPIDTKLAAHGQALFGQTCARCHGTYGPSGTYPNKIVPLETIGTDRLLAEAVSEKNVAYFNKSWLAHEIGPDGELFHFVDTGGYQSPPLDGIWATAPYFHNGSVPTLYDVLNSKARPKIFTRSFRTDRESYDDARGGWKVTVVPAVDPKEPAIERRKIYDTTQPGRGNSGHTFGDKLTEEERMAVIEYLKTL